uniref:RNA1 polyprotein n=1 Tax=Logan nepovirus TaxID=3115782 RepID=A0AAT9JAS1_9SECO
MPGSGLLDLLTKRQLKNRNGVATTIIPRAVLEASRIASALLAKPANFALSFLAQGASLKPRTVALAAANGIIATGPGFCIYTPEGVPLTWGDAARRVRPFARALAKRERSLYYKMKEELAFRKFQRQVPHMVAAARKLAAKKEGLRAKGAATVAARKAAAAAELAARRSAGLTRKSALRRSLKKKATKKVVKKVAVQPPKEPTLGSIFPFSSSLFSFSLPPKREVGISFSSLPSNYGEGEVFVPALLPGFVRALPEMGPIISLAQSFGPIAELCSPGAQQSLWAAVTALSHSITIHERSVFKRALVAFSNLFVIFPNVHYLGDFVGFEMFNGPTIIGAIERANFLALNMQALLQGNPIVHSFMDSCKRVGACISEIASSVKDRVGSFVWSKFDTILQTCKDCFFKCLSPWMATLHSARVEIENFWQRCKAWAESLWNGAHIALQALGLYAIWALVLTILCGIVYLLETMFITAGALSSHGLLVSAFLSVVLAAAGYTIFTVGKESAQMIRVMRESILMCVIPNEDAQVIANREDGDQEIHSFLDTAMVPVHFLESLSTGLSLFSTSSITVLGKLGNSLEGIRKGYNCLTDFISIFFDSLGNLWEGVSGKRTSFFRDVASVVKINLSIWTEDARRLIEYYEMAGLLDKYEYEKVRTLIYQGEEILDAANKGRRSHTSTTFLRTVGALVNDLKEVRSKCARSLRFDGWRRTPFWVYVYGASQCGKSTFANHLSPILLAHMGWDVQDVYSKDSVEGYWSGYFQQKCLKMNDLSAVTPRMACPLEQQLIPLISTEEKMVSAAEISGKGVQFLSEIAISSSNVADAPTSSEVLDGEAYRLRRKVMIRCRRAVEWVHNDDGTRSERVDAQGNLVLKPYNPDDALDCTEVQWVHPNTETALPGPAGQWHLAHSTIPLIKEAMDAHFLKEDRLKEAWVRSTNMKSKTAVEVSSYLTGLIGALGAYKPIQKDSDVSSAGQRKFLVAIDGDIYSLSATGVATKEARDAYDNVEALEALTLNQYRLDFAQQVRDHSLLTCTSSFHSSLVRDLMEDMLERDACVLSVDKISRDTKQIHRDLWNELSLAERVFLRISQKGLNQIRDRPHFKVSISNQFLECMSSFRDSIVDNRQKILLFMGALLLVGTMTWGFLSLMKTFLSGSIGFGGALALKNQLDIHSSVASSGSVVMQHSARSIPIVWSKAARYANIHSGIEEAPNFNLFSDGLAHLMVRLVGTSGQVENAILFGSRALALCSHQVFFFPDGDRVQVHYLTKERVARCFTITWHHSNSLHQQDTEVCIYVDDQLTPLPVYPDSLYLKGGEKLPQALNINGVAIKKKKFFSSSSLTPDERMLDDETPLIHSWCNVAALVTKKQTISGPIPGSSYSKDLSRYLTSTYACTKHDSGGLVSAIVGGTRRVVGLHCAGEQRGAFFRSTIAFLPTGSFASIHSGDDFFQPEELPICDGYMKIGFIADPGKRPHQSESSAIARVPENFELPLPVFDEQAEENFVDCLESIEIKHPAILSPKDSRLAEMGIEASTFRPLHDGMQKFAHPMKPLDDTILSEVCEDMYTTWYDALPMLANEKQLLTKVDLDVALNGVVGDPYLEPMKLDTSEGYPHCVERKPGESGKRRFVIIDDDFHVTLKEGTKVFDNYQELSATISDRVPTLNCVECLKDECLKKRKVATPRLFDTLPFEVNIILREYFLNFSSFIQSNRIYLPTCIGMNVYSREWTTLYDRLAEYSDTGLNCDYSKFDGYISHQIYSWLAATINRIFRDGEEANAARRNLLLMFIGRRSICGSQVYSVVGGMPSGCAFTALINSMFNEILIRYVYRKVVPKPACNYFNKYVRLMVYGDDNLITIKDEVLPFFDGPIIKDTLAQVGVVITDGTDKSSKTLQRKPLNSLDFLKRGFNVQHNGLVLAPLDKTSLYTRLFYSTKGPNGEYDLTILRDNVKSFLEEIVAHKNHYLEFCRVRNFFVSRIPSWADYLPSYPTARAFWEFQRDSQSPYCVARIFETRPHGGEYKMMAGQDKHDQAIYVTNRLVVCGPKFEVPRTSQSFVVALGSNLLHGERGVTYSVDIAPGAGQLPTSSWVDSFSSVKKRAQLHLAYNEGCTIYFRSIMPYYNSWCALGGFARHLGISTSSIITIFEEYKPKNGGDIAPLLASKEYKRHISRPIFSFEGIKQQLAVS